MSHQDYYRRNEVLAEVLEGWDGAFYAKYADTLRPPDQAGRVLDVGCGVGTVIQRLTQAGCDAWGVDVSDSNIERARKVSPQCLLYDGKQLPFPDLHFASAGALNVLEHVEAPEAFLEELVRVVAIGGRVVVSSPNFFRAIGCCDYHPRMRGFANKWGNWRRVQAKRRQMRHEPGSVRFDRMQPNLEPPFTPDCDAIVATNALEIAFFLRRFGCEIDRVECTDRYVARPVELLLNATPLRYLMFNAFVVARRVA